MSSLNRVTLIGNLGADPETNYTQSGRSVTNFRIATNERWTDSSGSPQERTSWHRVTVWGKQAETCAKYLRKGRTVCVEGRLQYGSYEKDGHTFHTTDIVAQNVVFLGGRDGMGEYDGPSQGGSSGYQGGGFQGGMTNNGPDDGDIPF